MAERCSEEERELAYRESVRSKLFLGFTSNLVFSGGMEEDLIKCLASTYKGDLPQLHSKGLNRIGNLLVPHDNYCKFEDWIIPIFDQMLKEQIGDIRAMNGEAVHSSPRKTGIIILGGGLPKHHLCNANMMRNGTDDAVFINTVQEFDVSDSGAHPDEAVSRGELRSSAKTVKVPQDGGSGLQDFFWVPNVEGYDRVQEH
ncbi:deoxyhypusine synthase isoform X2 [Populus alba x Populus x berolinensis]|nr:deoxyhypusine synthase isoform X2 [Populus alba x Populus x berolinensis]